MKNLFLVQHQLKFDSFQQLICDTPVDKNFKFKFDVKFKVKLNAILNNKFYSNNFIRLRSIST